MVEIGNLGRRRIEGDDAQLVDERWRLLITSDPCLRCLPPVGQPLLDQWPTCLRHLTSLSFSASSVSPPLTVRLSSMIGWSAKRARLLAGPCHVQSVRIWVVTAKGSSPR